MVDQEELPLEAVSGDELRLAAVHHGQLPDQLRRDQPPSRHEHDLLRVR